jgi:hypothetical protein
MLPMQIRSALLFKHLLFELILHQQKDVSQSSTSNTWWRIFHFSNILFWQFLSVLKNQFRETAWCYFIVASSNWLFIIVNTFQGTKFISLLSCPRKICLIFFSKCIRTDAYEIKFIDHDKEHMLIYLNFIFTWFHGL